MLIHVLVVIVFLFPSSAADDDRLTELKRISVSMSADDGEGQLMRLRTCRNEVMIQCDLCEVIRIINVSHAVGQTRLRNASEGCSGISFDQEFDCFRQGNKNYVSEVTRNCTGTQSCELLRGRAALNCSTLINTVSCCVEIFYTCEQRENVTLSSLFIANDTSGNVHNVSLHCQSLDLLVDSVVLTFSSSGEFHEGGICYKLSTNKVYVANRCSGKGCSKFNVEVAGESGCGRDKYTHNYGAFIYYICDRSRQNQCQRPVATTTEHSNMITVTSVIAATNAWDNSMTLLVIVVVVLVVAVLVSFVVGFIVGRKRKRKMRMEQQTRSAADLMTSPSVPRKTREGDVSQMKLERNTYQEISSVIVQDGVLENSQYCEIKDVEITVKQERKDIKRGRDNVASRKADEKAYTDSPGKLESKQTTDDKDIGGMHSTAVYALATMVYDELDQSTESPASISAEVDFSKHNINPVYETVDESNNDSIPDCNGAAQSGNIGKSVHSNSDRSGRDSKPLYAKVNKSKPSATNT